MNINLSSFEHKTFLDALKDFFRQLEIPINSISSSALSAKDVLKQTFKDKVPFNLINEIYFLGAVDDEAFHNSTIKELKDINEESKNILIFGVSLKTRENSLLPTRGQLAELTRAFNKEFFYNPVVVVFKYNDSYISFSNAERLEYKQQWREGKRIGKVSILKDINFINPHRGHIDILNELRINPSVVNTFQALYDYWQEKLSVSTLNEKFYKEISNWFYWARDKVLFPSGEAKDEVERNSLAIIRMLTRLIFVWFIKEKKLIPEKMFDLNFLKTILKDFSNPEVSNKTIFYKVILQNLFFATLNTKPENRTFRNETTGEDVNKHYMKHNVYRYEKFVKDRKLWQQLFKDIPFLNGGLFECLDKPAPDYENKSFEEAKKLEIRIDGFSDRDDNPLNVPDYLFFSKDKDIDLSNIYENSNSKKIMVKGLFEILNRYKFTIEENTPVEIEVALDPELLGKIFENLLAEYNPETHTTARKSTGSFYTPREIVDYMATESLKSRLSVMVAEKLEIKEDDIKAGLDLLFEYTEDEPLFDNKEKEAIIKSIAELKILDPACGSGAFPMGILHKLVFVLRKLDENNEIWRKVQKEKVLKQMENVYDIEDKKEREERLKDIDETFERNTQTDYGRKLYLIENSIYGVDIQPIAIQISKLRFFISLIVNQDNNNIKPLPNLETRFVVANTLIGIKDDTGKFFLKDLRIEKLEKKLKEIRHKHFNARNPEKKEEYRKKDKEIREKIADLLEETGWPHTKVEKLANWDPYDQSKAASFFDPEWMFGVVDGFDIVIGNPPYVQIQKFSGKTEQKQWQEQGYKTYNRMGDIYELFYERGNQILRDKGSLIFITSNKWMRAGYGKQLRKYFVGNTNPRLLIDFGGYKVFESATVDTNILLFQKAKNQNKLLACSIKDDFKQNLDIALYVKNNGITLKNLSEESWIILTEQEQKIKEKIEKIGTPLKDWDIKINYGIKTGFNEAFIIDGKTKDKLIKEDPKSAEIIKPILRGRDIKRYHAEFADLWLINTFPALHIDINQYPAVKKFLEGFKPKLEQVGKPISKEEQNKILQHAQKWDISVKENNLKKSRKKTGNKWFETQDQIGYYEEFEKEKIVYSEIVRDAQFYFDKNNFYVEATSFLMTGKNLKYLTAMLNSIFITFAFKKFYAGGGLSSEGYRYKKMFLEQLPIPKIPESQQKPFIELVDKILEKKEKGEATTEEERKIDLMVYKLYGLTYDEIKIIDPDIGEIVSKNEWEKYSINF